MYRRILVPTDGSVGTAHVALQAIDLAEQYGATVHALNVVDAQVQNIVTGTAGADADLAERGRQAVDRIARMARAHGVDVETAVETGDPAATILDYADAIDADLIVAGTHGRTGLERRLIGSVAERIVRRADRPVMTIRLPDTDVTVESAEEARDVAADALADRGVDAAVEATERQQSVWVVHADGPDGSFVVYVDPSTQRSSVVERDQGH